jgi:hypothetical protein
MKQKAILRILAALATRAPSLAFRVSDFIASLVWPRFALERAETLFGLSRREARRVTAQARNTVLRNQILLQMLVSGDLESVRRLVVPNHSLEALRPPIILGTFHVGALMALGPALERVPGRVLVLRRRISGAAVPSRLTIELTEGDEQHRARVFYRALDWLRGGASVFMPLDPEEAVRIAVPFRGRSLLLARGPFAMSRIMQVPIVPIVARWRGSRIEIILGDPIAPTDDESAIAAAAAAWLEQYLLESPLDISERILSLTR